MERQGRLTDFGAISRSDLARHNWKNTLNLRHLLFIVRVPQCWRLFEQHFYHFEDKVLSEDIANARLAQSEETTLCPARIRSNLFDAVGNYTTCIVSILGIGSQHLAHQRSIKQREAHIPVVDMTKSTSFFSVSTTDATTVLCYTLYYSSCYQPRTVTILLYWPCNFAVNFMVYMLFSFLLIGENIFHFA